MTLPIKIRSANISTTTKMEAEKKILANRLVNILNE